MSTADLFQLDADVGSDEDDGSFDEETGEVHERQNGARRRFEDSSEEEDDDDDEEAAAAVREGFIVDELDDDEEERQRKQEKRKRRREEREDEVLDEDDLDVIGLRPEPAPTEAKRLKRLKRGHRGDRDRDEPRGLDAIFSDENEDDDLDDRRLGRAREGEFDDFIEEDEVSDGARDQLLDDAEVSRRPKQILAGLRDLQMSGLDEADMEDMMAAFGDGTEYEWALQLQEDEEEDELNPNKDLELKDVFEPSQLADKMLTDEDNVIKNTDIPERFQLARKPFRKQVMTAQEWRDIAKEEKTWVSNMLWPKKRFEPELHEPFVEAVGDVLSFFNVHQFEVPFIFQHRKDHLIHAVKVPAAHFDPSDPDGAQYEIGAKKLLTQSDLWEIFEHDLKYRGLSEKREALQETYNSLKENANVHDSTVEELLPAAILMEEVQDIHEYLNFQYAAELKDHEIMDNNRVDLADDHRKRPSTASGVFAKIRAGKAYNVVRAFGTTADAFAQRGLDTGKRGYTDDPQQSPEDMADKFIDPEEFPTGTQLLRGAKMMFAEELSMSPRMRKLMRSAYYGNGHFDCIRTEKGLRKIDEDHPYYEFKYLRHQSIQAFVSRPELFLRMLKAESEGLIELKLSLNNEKSFKKNLYQNLESDNFSEVADSWNALRREALDLALVKLEKLMVKGLKENLRTECENQIARKCRDEYSKKLDQAPYKPRGMVLGTEPRVLALTNGRGSADRDAVVWAWVEEDGRVLENGKYTEMRPGNVEKAIPDGKDIAAFVELVNRRKPDVIGVSGFSVETRTLYKDLQAIVDKYDLRGTEYEDEDGNEQRDKVDVVMVNDEVARLYYTSDRAKVDHPGFAELTRYCVGLARYLQNPLKEYAALGRDIISITFDPNQILIPQEKLLKHLETAMVDMVNLVGVDINDAVSEPYTANLLPYVCGLGPRKAAMMLQAINRNGGMLASRAELVGGEGLVQATGFNVWENCASFIYIDYDPMEPANEYLDNTRVHPEDYKLARKMAADTLELDEEDVRAETDEHGQPAVVRRLVREGVQEKVNELRLEMYAAQLENIFQSKKRATLETIRAELQQPYEELRRNFALMNTDEIFTMLTGETRESLVEGMVVPVAVRKVFPEHIECLLDCGIEGGVSEHEFPSGVGIDGVDPRRAFQPHQTMQAKLLFLNRKQLTAQLSLREDSLRRSYRKEIDRMPGEWDEAQEDEDRREALKRTADSAGRAQRVIKHPMFRSFTASQAEEYLGQQSRGDVVIRPSSKGLDHLTVTWKVADGIFQHIDVLELDKENEFSVGRTLKIAGKFTYSDLDELIVNHVKAMAKKVNEIMQDERYQESTKTNTEDWLRSYMEANPRRSRYAFCINREHPGYFWLIFKVSPDKACQSWPIKVIPNAFELQKNPYPDMLSLKNGFKTLWNSLTSSQRMPNAPSAGARPPPAASAGMGGRPGGGYGGPPPTRVGGRY